jgi:hypothetical protein
LPLVLAGDVGYKQRRRGGQAATLWLLPIKLLQTQLLQTKQVQIQTGADMSRNRRSVMQPVLTGDTHGRTKKEDLANEAGLSPFC